MFQVETSEGRDNGQIEDSNSTQNPKRDIKAPQYLDDYVLNFECNDQILRNIDYCYRVHGVSQTFKGGTSITDVD